MKNHIKGFGRFINEENIRLNGIIRMGAVGIQQKSELQNFQK